ncbi:hypothetical protein [Thiohalorhabdus methylotrophus]|uniref:Uncharacterized protein n=1 Tax=Thiohalorhabdus methylotrophus TaxID=3242694 RepID=A0ABV4TXU7_9GAMM
MSELNVQPGDWLVERPLGELRLRDEGLLVQALECREGAFLSVPDFATRIRPGAA